MLIQEQFNKIEFYGILKNNSQLYKVLEKSKKTTLQFSKGAAIVL